MSNREHIKTIFYKSGKDYNDFGKYVECEADPNYNYLLAYYTKQDIFPTSMSMGFCVPSVCKAAELNELKQFFLPALNAFTKYIFADVEGFDLGGVQFSGDDIRFDNSLTLNDEYTKLSLKNGLFIAIIIFYVSLTVWATIVTHQRYIQRKKKRMQADNKSGAGPDN